MSSFSFAQLFRNMSMQINTLTVNLAMKGWWEEGWWWCGGGDTLLLLLLLPCREASSLHGTDSCTQIFEAGDEADRNSSGGGLRIED